MKLFIVFIFLHLSFSSFSQGGYAVIYKREDIYFPITFNGEKRKVPLNDNLLLFSDSFSLFYYVAAGNPLKKRKVFGEKLIHHALLYNKKTDIIYSEVNWPRKKNKYLIADTSAKFNWVFRDDMKLVLGYKCKPALMVNEKNDSTLVWFTPEIPEPFGPAGYFGLPGLVLEVFDQRSNLHLFADKLVKDSFSVVFPAEGKIVSKKEYWEIRAKK